MPTKVLAMWGVSNVVCNSADDASKVIGEESLLVNVVTALGAHESRLHVEALWTIGNLLTCASANDLAYLLNAYPGLLQAYMESISGGKDNAI